MTLTLKVRVYVTVLIRENRLEITRKSHLGSQLRLRTGSPRHFDRVRSPRLKKDYQTWTKYRESWIRTAFGRYDNGLECPHQRSKLHPRIRTYESSECQQFPQNFYESNWNEHWTLSPDCPVMTWTNFIWIIWNHRIGMFFVNLKMWS